jgi:hypothetical protein
VQNLTAPPRDGFTTAQVVTVMAQSSVVTTDFGLELLSSADWSVVDDLAAPDPDGTPGALLTAGAAIDRDMTATIHGTCTFATEQALTWGADMVRPYMLLSSPEVPGPVRFNLGVYLVTSPDVPLVEGGFYTVTGYDRLYLLAKPIGYTYQVPAGTNVFAAVRAAVLAGCGDSGVNLDSTKGDAVTAVDITLVQDSTTSPTWLDLVNQLLASIGYLALWADENGIFRSSPATLPALRSVEFILGAGDTPQVEFLDRKWFYHTVVSPLNRTMTRDTWGVPNQWRFIQNGLDFAPVEGQGQYTVNDLSGTPTSQTVVGRTVLKVVYLDAVDQDSLQTQGDLIVDADKSISETFVINTVPLPIAGHMDILQYMDPNLPGDPVRKVMATRWTLPLDGSDMTWNLQTINPPVTVPTRTYTHAPVGGARS